MTTANIPSSYEWRSVLISLVVITKRVISAFSNEQFSNGARFIFEYSPAELETINRSSLIEITFSRKRRSQCGLSDNSPFWVHRVSNETSSRRIMRETMRIGNLPFQTSRRHFWRMNHPFLLRNDGERQCHFIGATLFVSHNSYIVYTWFNKWIIFLPWQNVPSSATNNKMVVPESAYEAGLIDGLDAWWRRRCNLME